MELFIQEKLSLNGKMEIKDANGAVAYTGKNSLFIKGKTFLYDANGKKVITIKVGGFFTPTYIIKKDRKTVAKMKRKMSFVKQNFKVKGLDWDIAGNAFFTEFHITKDGEKIADIDKNRKVALLEGYSVKIEKEEDAPVVLATVMVINNILNVNKKNLLKRL